MSLLIILHIFFVSFLDKPEKSAPALSPRAVEQRAKWHIPTDQMDYPVSPLYLNNLRKMGVRVHHTSRWFNGATVEMDDATAAKVKNLSFVTAVEMTREESGSSYSLRRMWKFLHMDSEEAMSNNSNIGYLYIPAVSGLPWLPICRNAEGMERECR